LSLAIVIVENKRQRKRRDNHEETIQRHIGYARHTTKTNKTEHQTEEQHGPHRQSGANPNEEQAVPACNKIPTIFLK